ncbi:MAG: extracellular solute-binding protein [Streptosporangiaceae bacterium]|nr:extracellular solute-binding protein [Streptosporangiaceae bacterium]MBV9853323.1 extracellular solute-binding protein [Streptosporangiaceae bacterium]
MKARLIAVAAAGAATLTALWGCSSNSSTPGASASSGGKVTLQFYGADYGTGPANSTTKYWDAVAAAFHAANPGINVNVQTVDWTDFPTKVETLIQNKQYPDILEGNPAPPYAQSGLIYPVSDVLSQSTISNLIPKFLKDGQYQSTDYGIPFTTSTRAMYYNKKIFKAAGIASPPQTWAQLQADAAKIKAKGYIGYGMPLGSEEAQAELLLWFLGNGGGYVDSSGKYAINSSQNVAALNFMKQLAASGDTQPNPGGTDRKEVWANFAAGKIGMVLGSPAVIPIIQAAGVLKPADYGTTDVPGKNGPLTNTLGVHDDIVAFKAGGASHQAAIKKFLDFAYQDQWQLQFDNEYDLLPATQSAATTMAKNAMFSAFLGNITNSVNYPALANWTSVENQIKTQVGQAITGNPAQVLGGIQQTATSTGG